MDGDRGGFGDIGGGIGAGGQQDKGQIKRMDSDSEDVDGEGCGGAGGGIGAGGIGAGGSSNKKGLNPRKHEAADIRKARLPPQDDLPPPPLRPHSQLSPERGPAPQRKGCYFLLVFRRWEPAPF